MKTKVLVLALSLCSLAAAAQSPPVIFPEPMSPRIANYAIEVTLDPEAKTLEGRERILWKNVTGDTVEDAWFHLYLNAFANNKTVFMEESGGQIRGVSMTDDSWGYSHVLEILQVTGETEQPLTPEYPGEDNTVMRVVLAEPVPPGGETVIEVSFKALLPRIFARTGYAGDYFLVGQWFPKLGVYEEGRGWNCHTFHADTEFFADFGVYDVDVTVPKRFTLGASGIEWRRVENGELATVSYHAEDIHDFVWTASPDFVVREKSVRAGDHDVRCLFLMMPGNIKHQPRYEDALVRSIEWTAEKLAPYPYPQITVVDPPPKGSGSGGMEYPMFFTSMTFPLIPESLRLPEVVTVHEYMHGYFQGMSASNEFEEPWLDEGITSYYEIRMMEDLYGTHTSTIDGFLGWNLGGTQMDRFEYLHGPDLDPIVQPAWKYSSGMSYGITVFKKGGLMLKTLEGYLGRERFDEMMRHYFLNIRFTHPKTEDFLRFAGEAAGEDLRPLLDPLLFGTATVDYEIQSFRSRRATRHNGYTFEEGDPISPEESNAEPSEGGSERPYLTEIRVGRNGALRFPVDIVVDFEDGTQTVERWDASTRWKIFTFEGPRATRVVVDPDGKVPLDTDRFNNGRVMAPEPLPARSLGTRFRVLFQGAMVLLLNAL